MAVWQLPTLFWNARCRSILPSYEIATYLSYFSSEQAEPCLSTLNNPTLRAVPLKMPNRTEPKGEHAFASRWAGQGAPIGRAMPAAKLVQVLRTEWQFCRNAV